MTRRTATWVAWSMWFLTVTLLGFTLFIGRQNAIGDEIAVEGVIFVLAFGAFAAFGAFLASRRPNNAVGWLFLAIIIGPTLAAFGTEYGTYALVTRPGSLPAGDVLAWFGNWGWSGFGLVFFLLLLYPTGRLPSPRWRPIAWLVGVTVFGGAVLSALASGPLMEIDSIDNPFGLEILGSLEEIESIGGPIFLAVTILAFASLLVRFRRSSREERAQLKWFTFAAGFSVVNIVVADSLPEPLEFLSDALFLLAMVGLPAAATLAILKYRLYDIDVVINKTLVYGLLTGVLVGVYVGGVLGLGALVRTVGGAENNSVVVAISTLAVAALFRPARSRIQALIDRRFYRRKYDATRTLDAFSARLRDEVELKSLTGDLIGVVRETVQPIHASLWIRGEGRRP